MARWPVHGSGVKVEVWIVGRRRELKDLQASALKVQTALSCQPECIPKGGFAEQQERYHRQTRTELSCAADSAMLMFSFVSMEMDS